MNHDMDLAIGEVWSRSVIRDAIKEAAQLSGRTVDDIRGKRRDITTAHARQAVMWQAHRRGVANAAMARFFDMDHTTIAHGIRAAAERVSEMQEIMKPIIFKSTRTN